jgi:hypothetical protein
VYNCKILIYIKYPFHVHIYISGCLLSVININLLTSYIIASECTFAEMCVGCEGHDDGGIDLVLYCYVLI